MRDLFTLIQTETQAILEERLLQLQEVTATGLFESVSIEEQILNTEKQTQAIEEQQLGQLIKLNNIMQSLPTQNISGLSSTITPLQNLINNLPSFHTGGRSPGGLVITEPGELILNSRQERELFSERGGGNININLNASVNVSGGNADSGKTIGRQLASGFLAELESNPVFRRKTQSIIGRGI